MHERSCVVTGSASGIGEATARRLRTEGWSVVGDVSLRASAERAADAAEHLAPLRGWVNCAGIGSDQSAPQITEDEMRRVLDVNLIGTAWGCSVAVERMLAAGAGGAIVNISSVQALRSMPGTFVYAATKAADAAMARQIAVEYAHDGIRANAVLPGAIATPLNEAKFAAQPDPAAARRREGWLAPAGRLGTPEEVAACVAWLLSEDASFVSGHALGVDGGAAVWLTSSADAD